MVVFCDAIMKRKTYGHKQTVRDCIVAKRKVLDGNEGKAEDFEMLIKAKCEHCQSDFEDEGFEKTIFCPSCGKETHILPVGSNFTPQIANAAQYRSEERRVGKECRS